MNGDIVIRGLRHPSGLLMPNSLVLADKQINVQVFNGGSESVLLRAGEVIGIVSQLDDEDKLNGNIRQVQTATNDLKHATDLCNRSTKNLTTEQTSDVRDMLSEYSDIFAEENSNLGCLSAVCHKIETGDAKPIRQRGRRAPLGFEGEERNHLDSMLTNGVIQPSSSEWASPPVLVRKKDGSVRWCVDYRALNNVTLKDAYPLPLIDSCLDILAGAILMSTVDLQAGYWQIEIDP